MRSLSAALRRVGPVVGVRLVATGLMFVQTLALTRVFSAEVFGLYAFAQSLCAIATLIAALGFDRVLMRRLAQTGLDKAPGDPGWRAAFLFCVRVSAAATLALGLGGLGLFLFTDAGGVYTATLVAAALALPLSVFRKFSEALLLGAKRSVSSILGSQVAFPLALIAGAGATALLTLPREAETVAVVYVAAMAVSLALSMLLLRRSWPRMRPQRATAPVEASGPLPAPRELLASGFNFGLVSIGFVLGTHMDVLLTGALAGPDDAALVRVSARVAEAIGLVRAMAMMHYLPLLAEANARNDRGALRRHVRELTLIFVVSGAPLFVGLWIFAEPVMALFGEAFAAGAWVMRLYVIGVFFTMLAGPGASLLAMCGREELPARMLWGALGVNFALDLALIPLYGPLGCAIANMVSLLVLGVGTAWLAVRAVRVQPSVLLFIGKRGGA